LQILGSSWIVKAKKHIVHGLNLDHWEMMVVRE
jgi:hypothetical protein